jgi:transposase
MKPYCQDLRRRVLAKAKAGKPSQAAIAAQLQVTLSTVEKWLRRQRETGFPYRDIIAARQNETTF